MHFVSAVTVTSTPRAFLITSRRLVFCPLPENGAKKQQQLQRKLSGHHAGIRPEEKDTLSALVVSAVQQRALSNHNIQLNGEAALIIST